MLTQAGTDELSIYKQLCLFCRRRDPQPLITCRHSETHFVALVISRLDRPFESELCTEENFIKLLANGLSGPGSKRFAVEAYYKTIEMKKDHKVKGDVGSQSLVWARARCEVRRC
jgi:hypothetical protein